MLWSHCLNIFYKYIFVLTLHTAAVLSRFQNNIRSRQGGVTGCVYENIQVEYSIVDIVQSICYAAWIGEYLVMDLATLLGDVHCTLHREGGGGHVMLMDHPGHRHFCFGSLLF